MMKVLIHGRKIKEYKKAALWLKGHGRVGDKWASTSLKEKDAMLFLARWSYRKAICRQKFDNTSR